MGILIEIDKFNTMKILPALILIINLLSCQGETEKKPPITSNQNNSDIKLGLDKDDTVFHFNDSIDIGLFNACERKDRHYIDKFISSLDTVVEFQSFIGRAYCFSERVFPWGLISPDPKTGLFCEDCNQEIVRNNYMTGFKILAESCLLFGDKSDDDFIFMLGKKYFSFTKKISENEFQSMKQEIELKCNLKFKLFHNQF